MPAHEPSHDSATPIIVATASVTLAIGITVGALTGYFAPPRPTESPARESGSSPPRSAPAVADDAAAIVLVPVTRDQTPETTTMSPSGSVLAEPELVAENAPAWVDDDDDDDHHARRSAHHEREHDDDDD